MTMRQFLLIATLFATTATLSCTDAPEADSADATEAREVGDNQGNKYTVNTNESTLEWIGTKPTGQHHGTLKIKEGYLTVDDNNIKGGKFIIDVKSLTPDDQDEEGNKKLQAHLLSADFFDSEKYPDAIFEITGVGQATGNTDNRIMKDATHEITGNLQLKDVTKSISFPAKITIAGDHVEADANFNIDRTQWGMNYRSDKSLGDKMIGSDVNLKLHLVADK